MPFNYSVVDIGSHPYDVYADVPTAALYLDASITGPAVSWRGLVVDDQARTLVSATRWLDSVAWMGAIADPTQALQFPRTGLTDAAGQPVDSTTLPQQLIAACAELAAWLADDPDARADLSQPIPKSLRAGSVNIDYFRPVDVQILTPFPPNVMSLVLQWLAGQSSPIRVKGVKGKSEADQDLDFQHGF